MDLVLLHNQGFHKILQFFKICQCLSLHFVIKCVLNHRIRGKLCVQYKMNPFWAFVVVNYCNLWYPVISVRKWNVCYFFLIFCYQMKCPGTRRINLPLFFSCIFYYCHMNQIRYEQIIWTTLYANQKGVGGKKEANFGQRYLWMTLTSTASFRFLKTF